MKRRFSQKQSKVNFRGQEGELIPYFLLNLSFFLIKFDLPTKETKNVEMEFNNNSDFIRTTISPLIEYESDFKANCECLEKGKFMKHSIDYTKPLSVNNKRSLFRDYTVRL